MSPGDSRRNSDEEKAFGSILFASGSVWSKKQRETVKNRPDTTVLGPRHDLARGTNSRSRWRPGTIVSCAEEFSFYKDPTDDELDLYKEIEEIEKIAESTQGCSQSLCSI
ncbi:unnamed protein product [Cuscuta europaea]|uniref:Uncharacterized protein n=1 Tax=Cuscuta europaea TaxID=41803 RepID=A0A9P0YXC3_CUSEU|nr:unnamed protein product [Cuscuta europaea]